MGIANQAVQTGTLSMPHPEYSYIDLAFPGRLYSARENILLPAGIRTWAQANAKPGLLAVFCQKEVTSG